MLTCNQPQSQHLLNRQWTTEELLAEMTLEEKATLLAGVDDWHISGVPRFGVPPMRVTDCGHGVTLCGEITSPATCFPTAIGMASTWNISLMERVGSILGQETRALGCSMLLGPKVNLHRHPLNGRSFETFSEDPWLAGLLGAAIIRGIQREGVGACVKAMAGNNQQRDQTAVSSEIDERTLRELYLRVFELAVERGKPAAIMTAYNRLNGVHCAENRWLIHDVIKDDWQFPGLVVSDWRSVHTPQVYASGLDLEMPGNGKFLNRQAVLHAIKEGLLTEDEVNDKAERILRALLKYAKPIGAEGEISIVGSGLDTPESRALALEVAEESVVLLKNEGQLLPLDAASIKRVLVTGPNAAEARLGGGGSAAVAPFYSVSPLAGIREICGSEVEVQYLEGCSLVGTMEPIREDFLLMPSACGGQLGSVLAEYFASPEIGVEPDNVTTASQIDFSWGWASPAPGVQKGPFAVRFTGRLNPPVTGLYRVGVYAQEGCVRLRIGGEIVHDAWDDDAEGNFEEKYQTRYFTLERHFVAGEPVDFCLEYGKRAARAGLRLEWETNLSLSSSSGVTPDPLADGGVGAGESESPGATESIGSDARSVSAAARPSSLLEKVVQAARLADVVIVCAGLSNLFEGGSHDRSDINLPEAQQRLIEAVAAVNPRTVVVLNNGGPLSVPWASQVPALLEAWYPGQEGGRALARILFGQTNPSGRLPDTMAHRLQDHDSMRNYPGDGKRVKYDEGLFIGYRHFDRAGIEPHYPFGFGLSYTTFEIGIPRLARTKVCAWEGLEITVRVRVQNTGRRAGREVVQLYVSPRNAPLVRPIKELRAFQKLDLSPGEEVEATFSLGAQELAYFDMDSAAWIVAPGEYDILVGNHSRNLKGVTMTVEQYIRRSV